MGSLVLWALVSCVGDSPCPATADRFDPSSLGIRPEDEYETAGCVPLGEGAIVQQDWILVHCTEAWCSAGYLGNYCVSREAIEEWLDPRGVDYQCREGAAGDQQLCFVGCAACEGWCND